MPNTAEKKIILGLMAAGMSRRFGDTNKLFALFQEKPLVQFGLESLLDQKCPTCVVVGHEKEKMKKYLQNFELQILENLQYHQGLGSSIKTFLEYSISQHPDTPVLIHLGDLPQVTSNHIRKLMDAFFTHPQKIYVSRFSKNQWGPPLIVPSESLQPMLDHLQASGAKTWLKDQDLVFVDMESAGRDIDVPQDINSLT